MRRFFLTWLFASVLLGAPQEVFACDPCALFSATRMQSPKEGAVTLSLSEQYTSYDRAQSAEENSIRDGELVRGFSTTQLGVEYDVTRSVGIWGSLPFIARRFDEIEEYRAETKSDAGIGDLVLGGSYTFLNASAGSWTFLSSFDAALKLPTGDTGVLRDISSGEEGYEEAEPHSRHHTAGTASGGRALTFGTGSYDYIAGLNLLATRERLFFLSNLQYTFRTEGDFDYEFGDEILWSTGPGYYFVLDHDFAVAGRLALSGEFKDSDTLRGENVAGSQISNLYLGPELLVTLDEHWTAGVELSARVTSEDEGGNVVPVTRVRAGLSYRFW